MIEFLDLNLAKSAYFCSDWSIVSCYFSLIDRTSDYCSDRVADLSSKRLPGIANSK